MIFLKKKFVQCDEYGNCWETNLIEQLQLVGIFLIVLVPVLLVIACLV